MADKLKTPSVLAFERKLDPSDALFFSGDWNDRDAHLAWPKLDVREKSVRGTISNRLKTKDQDPAKLDASIQNPNLQKVDVAALPPEADTLCVRFTLRILSGVGEPSACNNADYKEKLLGTVGQYKEKYGFKELAYRYAYNIANGRFLWRNRLGAEVVEVRVGRIEKGETTPIGTFASLDFSLRDFSQRDDAIASLAAVIRDGLAGLSVALLEVVAFVRMGKGLEVYPSQELILDRRSGSGSKSKTLYQVNNAAGLHSQKLGNALRTIDDWYPDSAGLGPIAVEPYGSVTSLGTAYRQPKGKMDFYNLLDGWILKDKEPPVEQQHYVMANLIRGGVYGESEKE